MEKGPRGMLYPRPVMRGADCLSNLANNYHRSVYTKAEPMYLLLNLFVNLSQVVHVPCRKLANFIRDYILRTVFSIVSHLKGLCIYKHVGLLYGETDY